MGTLPSSVEEHPSSLKPALHTSGRGREEGREGEREMSNRYDEQRPNQHNALLN